MVIEEIPTTETGAEVNMGSFVLSIGNSDEGSSAWSQTSLEVIPSLTFDIADGLTLLSFDTELYSINRGTYGQEFCISLPPGEKFEAPAEFTIIGDDTFRLYP